jgi:hypothetical protein
MIMESIGTGLDLKRERMFLTALARSVYSAKLDGSVWKTPSYVRRNLSGIAYAELFAKFT